MVLPAILGTAGRALIGKAGAMATRSFRHEDQPHWKNQPRDERGRFQSPHPAQGIERAMGPLTPKTLNIPLDQHPEKKVVPFQRIYEKEDTESIKLMLTSALKILTSIESTLKAQLTHQKGVANKTIRVDRENRFEGDKNQQATKVANAGGDEESSGAGTAKLLIAIPVLIAMFSDKIRGAIEDSFNNFIAKLGEKLGINVKGVQNVVRDVGGAFQSATEEVADTVSSVADSVSETAGNITGGLIGQDPAHRGHSKKKRKAGGGNKHKAMREKQVYQAFRDQGLSHEGALAISAEVGRENSFQDMYLFGHHSDGANSETNLGILSWQGPRRRALRAFLKKRGLLNKDGSIVKSQEALNAQAEFAVREMATDHGGKGLRAFLSEKHVDPDKAIKKLQRFIRWDITGRNIQKEKGWSDRKRREWVADQFRNLSDHYAELMSASEELAAERDKPLKVQGEKAPSPRAIQSIKPNKAVSAKGHWSRQMSEDGSWWISRDGGDWVPTGNVDMKVRRMYLRKKQVEEGINKTTNNNTTVVIPQKAQTRTAVNTGIPNPNAGWGKDYHTTFGTFA